MSCSCAGGGNLTGMRSALILAVVALLAASHGSHEQDKVQSLTGAARTAMLRKIETSMAKVQNVVASFQQEKHLSLFGDVVKTKGCILYSRPDKLRWEIVDPFRSILIVSGDEVAKFEFHKGKRRRLELGRSSDIILMVMRQIRGWFRGDFEKSAKTYEVRVFASKPVRLELQPRDKAMRKNLKSIELRFTKDLAAVERVTIHENGGDKTVMKFRRLKKAEAKITKAHFDTREPRDFVLPK